MNILDSPAFQRAEHRRYKAAQADFAVSLDYTHAVSFAWNRDRPLAVAFLDLKHMHAVVDAAMLGRRFNEAPPTRRTLAYFTFEHLDSNLHAHGLWRVPHDKAKKFEALFAVPPPKTGLPSIWGKRVPGGTAVLRDPFEVRGWVEYIHKEQHMRSDDRRIVWSREFIPAH